MLTFECCKCKHNTAKHSENNLFLWFIVLANALSPHSLTSWLNHHCSVSLHKANFELYVYEQEPTNPTHFALLNINKG